VGELALDPDSRGGGQDLADRPVAHRAMVHRPRTEALSACRTPRAPGVRVPARRARW
jgi:hypothetical protein